MITVQVCPVLEPQLYVQNNWLYFQTTIRIASANSSVKFLIVW